ncbi:MAG: DUF5688 family protein [Eubacteriales bacterium]|nr:DUF5688 family protein [Eubacteriales bacterium]
MNSKIIAVDEYRDKLVLKNIMGQLINKELHRELVESVPHRNYLDLGIIYRIIVAAETEEVVSFIVTNSLMDYMGVCEEHLYNAAIENLSNGIEVELESFIPAHERFLGNRALVLTNELYVNGAFQMLCTNRLDVISRRFDSDLIIFPSSIHEIIVVPECDLSRTDNLKTIIHDVNNMCLDSDDILSDHPYRYDREKRFVSCL